MSIIKKYLLVIIITGIFITLSGALLLGPFAFSTITTSTVCDAVLDHIAEQITSTETGVTYELIDLKTETRFSYPKQKPFIPVNYTIGGAIVEPQTSLYLVHEGNLTRGSKLTLEFEVIPTSSGVYHYYLINETGVIDEFEITDSTSYYNHLKIKKTGNYAIILSVEDALGDYKLNYHITRSILPL